VSHLDKSAVMSTKAIVPSNREGESTFAME
jgi:hypothetical protein